MHHQSHGYFGLIGIGNVGNKSLPNTLVLSDLQNLSGSTQEVQKFYVRLRSDMIAKSIEGSITKKYPKKLRLFQGEYERSDAGGLIRNDGPTMLYPIFKIINPATRIGVSNLKDEIEK